MNAQIFLAAFLGCLFAMTFVAIAAYGVIKWRTRRFLAKNAQEIAARIKAEMTPEEQREMQAFARQFMPHADSAGPESPPPPAP